MAELIYCATPSRLVRAIPGCIKKVMDIITDEGDGPLHPFQALPYERYEGNSRIGRDETIRICCRLIDACDRLAFFGVSTGTLIELAYADKTNKPVRLHLDFDPEWGGILCKARPAARQCP